MLTAAAVFEIRGLLLTGDEVAAMGFWIADCPWADLDGDDVADLSREEIVAGIEEHYEGGVRSFLATLSAELEV